jgi:transposase-like protein
MTHFNFTVDDEIVRHAFLSELYPDGQSKFLEVVLNQLLQTYASEVCGPEPYQQSETRSDYRNGYRSRRMTTKLGSIELEVPRLRNRSFSIDFLKNYKRQDQDLIVGIAEMYVQGVSIRNVPKVTNILLGESISQSTV